MTCGIYQIRNTKTGAAYLGSSVNIENRWAAHRKQLESGKHHSKPLQKAWNAYGPTCFAFSVIESVSIRNMLIEREQFWLNKLNPFGRKGYNVAKRATSPLTTVKRNKRKKVGG